MHRLSWTAMLREAAAVGALVSTVACAGAWPRVIATSDPGGRVTRGEWLASYDDALVTIAHLMTEELGLPAPQASVYLHRNRQAFQAALEAEGYDPELARITATELMGVSGFRRVLVNHDALLDLGWPQRVSFLAHELTHTLQYEFGGGTRGTSEQWLREGFAEWVEVQILVALGFSSRQFARDVAIRNIRAGGADQLPPLSEMVTFSQWAGLLPRFGQEAIYAKALVAAEALIERHGVAAVIDYFKLFAASDDRLANFRQAFGQDLPEFERAFTGQLAAELR